MSTGSRDSIYKQRREHVAPFEFDQAVSEVFDDMVRRSIPGYETVVRVSGALVAEVCQGQGLVYDLGASLGEGTASILAACGDSRPEIALVDSSKPMMKRCRERFAGVCGLRMLCVDVCELDFEPAIAFVMNYTLQFIDPISRDPLLSRIRQALLPGGVLVLSEKIRLEPDRLNEVAVRRHHEFKRLMGYSDQEIAQKRDALERVLIPETLHDLTERLHAAGFSRLEVWFRCLNWVSIAAHADA